MKNELRINGFCVLFLCLILNMNGFAQEILNEDVTKSSKFSIGLRGGYDFPLFDFPYQQLKYKGGRYIGVHLDYQFASKIGIRLDYTNIITRPDIKIPNEVYYGSTASPTTQLSKNLNRQFVGLGPSYQINIGTSKFSVLFAPMIGYFWLSGGDVLVTSPDPLSPPIIDTHLLNTGFQDKAVACKGDIDFKWQINRNLKIILNAYYLRSFQVEFDNSLDVGSPIITSIIHGENIFDQTPNPYTVTSNLPFIVAQPQSEEKLCADIPSVGVTLGIQYTFGKKKPVEEPEVSECSNCGCPDDKHKVVVTVRDDISKKVIPDADVAIINESGEIISTGSTNSYGVVDFGEIPHGNYNITGNVFGIETTTTKLIESEFTPNTVIQKEILYDDLRFILKGVVVNKADRVREPNVLVNLTKKQDGNVKQDNSDGKGEFVFRLEKNSSYEVVGVKENKLSDIDQASTLGLTRSTTLFVDLELGVDNFECNGGTVLDIKYELDKHFLLPESKFELDRLVRYIQDHNSARIELGSHTDSRGSKQYNLALSERRAKSAVDYIVSKGISRTRIYAQGYGETRLLNRCNDEIKCSESEHRINRRTEAKLICN